MNGFIPISLSNEVAMQILRAAEAQDLPWNLSPGLSYPDALSFELCVDGKLTVHEVTLYENGSWRMKTSVALA
jgi:hypothetical protein